PSRETMRRLQDGGVCLRAVRWMVGGMNERTMLEGRPDREALRRQLSGQGLRPELIENMLRAADVAGGFAADDRVDIPPTIAEDVEGQAVTIALATFESRFRIGDLEARVAAGSALATLYRDGYAPAIEEA